MTPLLGGHVLHMGDQYTATFGLRHGDHETVHTGSKQQHPIRRTHTLMLWKAAVIGIPCRRLSGSVQPEGPVHWPRRWPIASRSA
jgi:hypothetical protein